MFSTGQGYDSESPLDLGAYQGRCAVPIGPSLQTSIRRPDSAKRGVFPDTAEQKGYDAGKKVSGIKRHIAVDTQGLPHAI